MITNTVMVTTTTTIIPTKSITKGDVFSEFLLMSIATVGAFSIREYQEGVAGMLFYSVGEVFGRRINQ